MSMDLSTGTLETFGKECDKAGRYGRVATARTSQPATCKCQTPGVVYMAAITSMDNTNNTETYTVLTGVFQEETLCKNAYLGTSTI